MPCFARDFGNVCFNWHLGKTGQDEASHCGLLVVRFVVMQGLVTTKH